MEKEIEQLKILKKEFDNYRPTEDSLNSIFGEGNWFIIDQPYMHYAGGDFYFIEKKDDIIYIIIGDSTGKRIEGAEIQKDLLPIFKNIIEKSPKDPDKFLNFFLKDTGNLRSKVKLMIITISDSKLSFKSHDAETFLYLFKNGNPPLSYTNNSDANNFPELLNNIDKIIVITDWAKKKDLESNWKTYYANTAKLNLDLDKCLKDSYQKNLLAIKSEINNFIKPLRITQNINGVEIIDNSKPIINDDITVLGLDFKFFK